MLETTSRDEFRPQVARYSILIIIAGALLVGAALIRGVLAYQRYYSPFDAIDSSVEDSSGFLPLPLLDEVDYAGLGLAPAVRFSVEDDISLNPSELIGSRKTSRGASGLSEASGTLPLPAGLAASPDTRFGASLQAPRESLGLIPDRLIIPALGVDSPVVPVGLREIEYKRQIFQQWAAPDFYAAGWHNTSARLGTAGNTVLNGHHNAFGEVFKDLINLEVGDMIYVYSGDQEFVYVVGLMTRFDERFRPIEERLENARWILPSNDERLTIITCWPYESNTHRVVIVAVPTQLEGIEE